MQVSLRTTSDRGHRQRARWAGRSAGFLLLVAVGGCAASLAGGITEANVAHRITNAKTAAHHEALATYFRDKAQEIASEQIKHEQEIIDSYKEATARGDVGSARARIRESMRKHCRALTDSYRRVQENYLRLSEDHARMARQLLGRP